MKRLSIAFRCFFSLLVKGKIAQTLFEELRTRVAAAKPTGTASDAPGAPALRVEPAGLAPQPPPRKPDATRPHGGERAVQVLALLQRDARLIDFIKEDIAAYDDAQVGAAVRDMHASCRATLERYLALEPVVDGEEGNPITVPAGFDPAAIKLIGNVTGKLPARGILRHHGWRAAAVHLPDLPAGAGTSVVAPAEVEVS
jgi:hypothetical protein